MGSQDAPRTRARGGLADKRRAILAGALAVFARDGYTHASIDAISAEAGVSTRTIYNHFRDKAELFRTVIQDSTDRVAESQIATIDRHLGDVTDLESDLVEFAKDWILPAGDDRHAHFSLVRQLDSESAHVPPGTVETWQENGPLRVRRELARRLGELADRGLLRADDPDLAAVHFGVLISAARPVCQAGAGSRDAAAERVAAAVRAFLYGYGAGAAATGAPAARRGRGPADARAPHES
ncbi:TetR/AcrR family transcriptional regulator [Streptomyces sp. B1866]|uniref:TetR/AcrR family transcriptional regulator n=1 Tax=Streptomyces sp. B1866 TaxID=3075431 RepID=UPI002890F422|nr:TetR/AcrR family transcriptional regulator [Streptomyces sp. B1866]MDT3399780.1 TetR/AcrR family transcriptional regulator [Streptomyces sp. B1866]